jgi:glucosyl-dolichyl phosphate glucuronosyltransferase
MDITVAICTWNRAKLLDATLTQMRNLHIPQGLVWELLVVNNRCTDETDEVIAKHEPHLPLRRLYEENQGLSYARNCAMGAAHGELLIWTDDDVLVDEHWLESYYQAARNWSDAAFFGGTIQPWYESPPPAWVENNKSLLRGVLALIHYDDAVRPFAPGEEPIGASMGFRLKLLKQYGFDVALGHVANQVGGGEDSELIKRMMRAGLHGVYVGTAIVHHWVPRARMTYKYVWKWCFQHGVLMAQLGRLGRKRIFGIPLSAVKLWAEGIAMCSLGFLARRDQMQLRGWTVWAWNAGVLSECFRQLRGKFSMSSKNLGPSHRADKETSIKGELSVPQT